MMRNYKRFLSLAGAALLLSSAHAAQLACPPSLPADVIQLNKTPDDWRFFAEAPMYLHSAAPITGPPETRGHLKEDSASQRHGIWTYTYNLDGPYPNGKWMQCGYGEHDEMTLSKRIADHISVCVITYNKATKTSQQQIQINCR
ncbi:STY0301 family protein [Janthinobacterium sp. HH01]|uniref:STY0301 family protein n=1 Tax=Janthinobacterium sp. HH01 TaxID=1198452 RepID=UPI0005BBB53D|nr:STY0301 family protein [Janthinobacterium sp. HH01]